MVNVEGRGTAILERRDGRCLMVHLHTSSQDTGRLSRWNNITTINHPA